MSPTDWEQRLVDLGRVATRVRRWPGREWWRFAIDGAAYRLHYYPADVRGARPGAAAKEYAALQTLQRLKLPALRPVLLLSRLKFDGRVGDAVVITDVNDPRGTGFQPVSASAKTRVENPCRATRDGVIAILVALNESGLGHADLRPDAFVVGGDGVKLADAAGIVQGGVTREHLMQFAHAAGSLATTADRVRAWRRLVPGGDVPPPDRRLAARFRADSKREAVERTTVNEWTGRFIASTPAVEWSAASTIVVSSKDWQREWPAVVAQVKADALDVLKRDASGDVLAATVTLGGRPVDVVLKRPLEKYWYRRLTRLTRASRARRAWEKARLVRVRGVAVEPPLAVFERRRGVGVESVAVFERVPGDTLEKVDLGALSPRDRDALFRRCGRILRRLEDTRLAHTDAKSSNWIVFPSRTNGPTPVLIDAYGVRWLNPWLGLFGLHRLLRAMKNHAQYAPADSLAICQGFAPRASPNAEPATPSEAADAN